MQKNLKPANCQKLGLIRQLTALPLDRIYQCFFFQIWFCRIFLDEGWKVWEVLLLPWTLVWKVAQVWNLHREHFPPLKNLIFFVRLKIWHSFLQFKIFFKDWSFALLEEILGLICDLIKDPISQIWDWSLKIVNESKKSNAKRQIFLRFASQDFFL